jgi:hypothetical protein
MGKLVSPLRTEVFVDMCRVGDDPHPRGGAMRLARGEGVSKSGAARDADLSPYTK